MRRLSIAFSLALSCLGFGDKPITVTFLHLNDTHSHLEPTIIRGKPYGGFARLAHQISTERKKEKNVLLLHGGDAFQGTLYFNTYEGLADAVMLNKLGVNAMALGNHEFDRGPGPLSRFLEVADFPVVAANVDFSREPRLQGVLPSTVLRVDGERIGVVGTVTPTTPSISSPGPTVGFRENVPSIQAAIDQLTKVGVNKIVVLSHNGYEEEQELARQLKDVDIIIGGHSHTLLGTPAVEGWPAPRGTYPTLVNGVLVVQAWEWGKVLGKLKVEFDAAGKVKFVREATPIVIDGSIPEDRETANLLAAFRKPIEAVAKAPVGETSVAITRLANEGQEKLAGYVVADAMLATSAKLGAVATFINSGGLRADINPGVITYSDAIQLQPFNNTLVLLDLTGAELRGAIEEGLPRGGLLYPSANLRYRAEGGKVLDLNLNGKPVEAGGTYTIGFQAFTANGGDAHAILQAAKGRRVDTGILDIDILVDYLKANRPLNPKLDGRVNIRP